MQHLYSTDGRVGTRLSAASAESARKGAVGPELHIGAKGANLEIGVRKPPRVGEELELEHRNAVWRIRVGFANPNEPILKYPANSTTNRIRARRGKYGWC